MPIAERGYTHWDGQLLERRRPWSPITRQGIRLALKRKYFKFSFFVSLLPAFGFLVGIYAAEKMQDFKVMVKGSPTLLAVNPGFFRAYFAGDFLLFMMLMLMVLAGAGLISDELRHNALQLYFARPLSKKDYFLGKAAILVFFLSLVTVVPGLVFVLFKLIFSGSFRFLAAYPWIPLAVIGYSALVTAFFSFYTLMISSVSKNRRYTAILLFTVYIFSDVLFGIFHESFRSPYFALLSIKANLQQVGAAFFNVKPPYPVPWLYSLLVLLAVCAASALVLRKRVKGVEVVK
jgi:ABC-type transport system involved in multi-copper enzyme maturation permease subunit